MSGSEGRSIFGRLLIGLVYVVGFCLSTVFCYELLTRLGLSVFVMAAALACIGGVYLWLSLRDIAIPFMVWILTIGGFRFLWHVEIAVLPDVYLDRMAMIWLALIFMAKATLEKKRLRRPGTLDALILIHGVYLYIRILMNDGHGFHIWTMSYLIPYSAYFLAKNIVVTQDVIRKFLLMLLMLSIYYHITSIAEKFSVDFLIWPKSMIDTHSVFIGRSNGPFKQAPLFGTVIGIMLPIHLYFLATTKSMVRVGLVYLSLGMGFAGLYFTYTRGSWLTGVLSLGVAAMLNREQYLRRLLPLLVVAPVLAVTVLGIGQDSFMKKRMENDQTLGARVGTALTAIDVWRDHPLFGVGFFSFRENRQNYIKAHSVPILGNIKFNAYRENPLHDIYLGPLAEDGLVGALLQFFIYFFIFRVTWRNLQLRNRGDPVIDYVFPVLAGLFLGYLIGGIAIDYRYFSFVGTLFYASAGIVDGHELSPVEASGPVGIHLPSVDQNRLLLR